jgi:hypothetical protein
MGHFNPEVTRQHRRKLRHKESHLGSDAREARMELVIGGAVILLVGSFVVWKLLHKSEPKEPASTTFDSAANTWLSKTREDGSEAAFTQVVAVAPVSDETAQPAEVHESHQETAKAPVVAAPQKAPASTHVEALETPRANKVAEQVNPAQSQKTAVPAEAPLLSAKDEAEDWLGFVPSLTAKGGEDADTELVFDED